MPIASPARRLSIEGDFDEHFALHSPPVSQRDAVYIFTPDLMALLIDETGDFDVEIVDVFVVYSRHGFDLSNGDAVASPRAHQARGRSKGNHAGPICTRTPVIPRRSRKDPACAWGSSAASRRSA